MISLAYILFRFSRFLSIFTASALFLRNISFCSSMIQKKYGKRIRWWNFERKLISGFYLRKKDDKRMSTREKASRKNENVDSRQILLRGCVKWDWFLSGWVLNGLFSVVGFHLKPITHLYKKGSDRIKGFGVGKNCWQNETAITNSFYSRNLSPLPNDPLIPFKVFKEIFSLKPTSRYDSLYPTSNGGLRIDYKEGSLGKLKA